MDTWIHLITLLCIGWIVYTNNSGLPLELTQFQSGGNITLVCSSINTTISTSFRYWYMDEVRVLTSVFVGHDHGCNRNPPNNDTAYRYDLFTSNDGSVSCGGNQHNMTLTTTQYIQAGAVWRCDDQRHRVSNNLTLVIPGTTDKSTTPLTDSATTITTDSDTHGFHGTTYKRSSQLTTLANLTTIKLTSAPSNDNQDDAMYIAAGTGGGIFILIIIVICVCVVRTRRKGNVTQDVSLAGVDAPQYDTLAHNGNTDPCYSEIKKEASRHSSINANCVYYNTVPENADYENPQMIT
ncbi:uncharacterized protein LOC125381482 [Haliotis rufescens]|uniref:uncharacterized protein LOC125381482 n=1 Tax=Haliotis rufescens TaxID=6454 RepID=UPI00201ED82C|nr:uncharacterized protein LOC125381482 [Haliotis rufescens]